MRLQPQIHHTDEGAVRYWVSETPATDRPWLVFLPGLTADHTLFTPQLKYFLSRANCCVWDAPAHGQSRPYPLTFTLDTCAHILHDILCANGIDNPILIGQSFGGYISQCYMHLYPGTAGGVIAIDTAPLSHTFYPQWQITAMKYSRLLYQPLGWRLLQKIAPASVAVTTAGKANMRSMMSAYSGREYVDLADHGYRLLAEAIETRRDYSIDCPALLLCGEKDTAGSVRQLNRQWERATGLPLKWVANAGHNSTIDAPEFINTEIETFLVRTFLA